MFSTCSAHSLRGLWQTLTTCLLAMILQLAKRQRLALARQTPWHRALLVVVWLVRDVKKRTFLEYGPWIWTTQRLWCDWLLNLFPIYSRSSGMLYFSAVVWFIWSFIEMFLWCNSSEYKKVIKKNKKKAVRGDTKRSSLRSMKTGWVLGCPKQTAVVLAPFHVINGCTPKIPELKYKPLPQLIVQTHHKLPPGLFQVFEQLLWTCCSFPLSGQKVSYVAEIIRHAETHLGFWAVQIKLIDFV